MKYKYLNKLIIILLIFVFSNCGKPQTYTVVIVQQNKQLFTAGEPVVRFHSNGASLDYFVPGAIIILKTDYKVFNQQGKSGKAYQISKDNQLIEVCSIDTTLNDTTLVNKFLITDIQKENE